MEIYNTQSIFTVATENYKKYLFPFIESLKLNSGVNLELLIIHNGLKTDTINLIEAKGNDKFKIKLYNILDNHLAKRYQNDFENPVYWRLIGPRILKNYKKTLYLDADTIVIKDLNKLFKSDIADYVLAAAVDYIEKIGIAVSNYKELKLDPSTDYFNAGVLLINTAKYLADNIDEACMDIVSNNREHLVVGNKWPQNDQYALNVTTYGKWKRISNIYNYGSELEYNNKAIIVHYIGNGKPDSPTCKKEFKELFYKFTKISEI